MKKAVLLLVVTHLYVHAYTQNSCHVLFTGRVLDESNQPMIGASVRLLPTNQGQPTNARGNFRFEGLCAGTYEVHVNYLGYRENMRQIEILDTLDMTIRLVELATQLDEVIVENLDPASMMGANNFVKLDEKQLSELAGKSLGESLKALSGVNSIQTGPGIFKPVIHGVHSQRILILNYGIRQEGQQWGAEHAPEIDPFIASSITVIKDAGAIKYGTDALGGVIVVNPPPLPERAIFGGSVISIIQSNGRSGTFSGMLEGGIKNHPGWGWRVQGTAKRTGDFHTPDYSLTNTGIKELNFSTSTGYHKAKAGFDIFFSHFQTEIGILKGTSISNLDDLVGAMERSMPQYTSGFSYAIGEPRQDVSHNLIKINGHIKTDVGEFQLQYGFQNNNRKEFDIRKGQLSSIPSIDLKLNTHTLDGEWEILHTTTRTLSVGINTMLQDNSNIPGTQRIPFIPNFNSVSTGVFGITKLYFTNWALDLGGRYDYRHYSVTGYDFKNSIYHSTFDFNNPSGSAGATVRFKRHQTLHLNLSSSWRPPHVAELFSIGTHQSAAAIEYGLLLNDSTNEVMDISQVHFKTEQALKFVTTYQKAWRNVSLEISPYANYIFNYIYLQPGGVTKNIRGVYPYFRYTQTDALFLGVDASATWQANAYFKIIPQVSLLRAGDVRHHDFLVFIPPNRYEVAVRYEKPTRFIFHAIYIESKTRYTAKQRRTPRVISVREIKDAQEGQASPFKDDTSNFDFTEAPDGYFLWNLALGASVRNATSQLDFRIASENTLNQRYRDYTNRFRYYADDLGRNIIFSIKCIF